MKCSTDAIDDHGDHAWDLTHVLGKKDIGMDPFSSRDAQDGLLALE